MCSGSVNHQKITSENSLKLQQQINGNLERKNLLSRGPNMTPGGLSYTEIHTYDIFLWGGGGRNLSGMPKVITYVLHPVLDIDINVRHVESNWEGKTT